MKLLYISLIAAPLAVGSAIPAPESQAAGIKRGFTIEQVENPHFEPNGPAALAKALNKYGAYERAAKVALATRTTSGTVSAVPVQIGGGSSPQTLQLDFDTGSSDLWVFSDQLDAASRGSHNLYTSWNIKGKSTGETWSITYSDGSGASGKVYKDTVAIGSATVTSQAVEAATSVSSQFAQGASDGVVGLAFDVLNTVIPRKSTFITNAIAQGLPKGLFTADLKYHAAGSYDFGYIDTSKYTGSITYAPVDTQDGYWAITPSSYSVGSGSAQSGSLKGFVDTGTTLILVYDPAVTKYYASVPGAVNSGPDGGWVFPCSATLPSFSLTISGFKATVPGKYLNYAPLNSTTCYGGLQSNAGLGISVYGDVFIKSQFFVFDRSRGTSSAYLGLAKKTQ